MKPNFIKWLFEDREKKFPGAAGGDAAPGLESAPC